jgi:hypothetical protein
MSFRSSPDHGVLNPELLSASSANLTRPPIPSNRSLKNLDTRKHPTGRSKSARN